MRRRIRVHVYRDVLSSLAVLAGLIGSIHACVPSKQGDREGNTRIISFDTTEFTDAHVDVSPDGNTIVFDLLGDLYTVPMGGGDVTPLTTGSAWDIRPRYSPDGERIAFVSDRGGVATLWTIGNQGDDVKEYPVARPGWRTGLVPAWTPDGDLLDLVPGEPAPSMTLHRLVDQQRSVPFSKEVDPAIYRGSFSEDGRYAYYGGAGLQRVELHSGEVTDLGVKPERGSVRLPRVNQRSGRVAYVVQEYLAGEGELCTLHVRDMSTGADRALANFPGCSTPDYSFVPDGTAVIANLSGKLTRVDVATGAHKVLPVRVHANRKIHPPLRQIDRKISDGGDVQAAVIRWPTLSASGSDLTFSAFANVYVKNVPNGRTRRLTKGRALEYAPALSPDGQWVAYTTWSDTELGHVMIAPIHGGASRKLTTVPGRYVNPVWSPDGTRVAFISDETEARLGLKPRFRGPMTGNWPLALKWVSVVDGGELQKVLTTSPIRVEPNRFHPVPSFSADGERIYISRYVVSEEGGRSGPVLVSVNLDGSDVEPHLYLPEADEVVVSPDGRRVAVVWQGRLYVSSIPRPSGADEVPEFDLDSAQLVTADMPTHISWQDENALIWAEANRMYRYRLGGDRPELVTEVNVRGHRPVPGGCFALVGARLVTMRGDELIERGTLVVCGNRITAMGHADSVSVPEGAQIVDAHGTTIIPGILDVHAHFHHPPSEVWLRQNVGYVGSLAYGVTTLYDPSAPTLDVFGQAEMVEIGEILGPRIYSSGLPIVGGEQGGSHAPVVQSLDDARTVVAAYARYGAGPLKEYFETRRDRRRWLVQAAQEAGVSMTSHPDAAVLPRVVDGFTAFEHDFSTNRAGNGSVYDDVLQFLAASGVNYTRDSLGGLFSRDVDVEDPKLRRLNPKARLQQEAAGASSPEIRVYLRNERQQSARILTRLVDLGGLVSIGAHGNGVPGLATHQELWALVLLGDMDPYDALRAATLNGARKLDLETDLGSIEPGKVADLVVLNSNPLEDIRSSVDIRWVIKDGFVYDGDSMIRMWPSRKELDPWPWQSDEDRTRFAAPDTQSFSPR